MDNVDLLCGLGSFEDLEMGSLSVQVYLHLLSHHLNEGKTVLQKSKNVHVKKYLLGNTFICFPAEGGGAKIYLTVPLMQTNESLIVLTCIFVFAEQQSSVVAAFSGLLYRRGRRPKKKHLKKHQDHHKVIPSRNKLKGTVHTR